MSNMKLAIVGCSRESASRLVANELLCEQGFEIVVLDESKIDPKELCVADTKTLKDLSRTNAKKQLLYPRVEELRGNPRNRDEGRNYIRKRFWE